MSNLLQPKSNVTIDNPIFINGKAPITKDHHITLKAKGIYLHFATRSEDKEFSLSEIVMSSPTGINAIQNGIQELIRHGYMTQRQDRGEGKVYRWFYEVFREPRARPALKP